MVVPMEAATKQAGVKLALNQMVKAFHHCADDNGIEVETSTGDRYSGQIVILGLGVRPRLELAKSAGLEVGERGGIAVDEHMRTSDPDIYAAGDEASERLRDSSCLTRDDDDAARDD